MGMIMDSPHRRNSAEKEEATMAPPDFTPLVPQMRQTAADMARLAEDETIFRALIDAFRAEDAESFQRLLRQFEIAERCELICRWIRSKECVRICIELCGPPTKEEAGLDDIPAFAEIVAKITGDEELIERLAAAIDEEDAEGFQSLVRELQIERFRHLLCHWACVIRCRLRCEVVCAPEAAPRRHFIAELAVAGASVGELLRDKDTFQAIIRAGLAFDCEILSGGIGGRGDCFLLCEWICSWRCVLICLPLCIEFPPIERIDLEEMREFAQVTAKVLATEGAAERFLEAVAAQDPERFSALVKEFGVERFCLQLCHWFCFEICRIFCICVCPEPETVPLFTHVGMYRVDPIWNDFTADGTTTSGGFAFTETIPLRGILPDGSAPDALEYRFLHEKYPLGGGPQPVDATMIPSTVIGSLEYYSFDSGTLSWTGPHAADYYVNNPGATVTIPQPGPPLVVSVNKDVKPGGWIEVPRENQLFFGGVGRFIPMSGLANLDTTKLTDEQFDLTPNAPPLPLKAGDSMPSGDLSEKPTFQISFEARKVGQVPLVNANNLDTIALSNTHFTYIRHPLWAGGQVTTILALSVDVQELIAGGGCVPLSSDVHALFTAYHPYMNWCDVRIEGPGIPPPNPVTPVISADGEATSPAGGEDFNIASLTPCAYIVWLEATLALTVGYGGIFGTFSDHVAFCKQ
jgi:hypothetical protein